MLFPEPAVVAELRELAMLGDINELEERVQALDQVDERLRPFVGRMRQFLHDYQLERLSEWLEPQ